MRSLIVAAAALATGAFSPALAQDAYVVGITAALTGPPASTYAPGRRSAAHLYRPGQRRGRHQRQEGQLIIQDDSAEPSKAAANAKKLLTQDNVVLLLNASLSSTYAPMLAEAKRAGVPLVFASSVCPKEVLSAGERRPVLHHGVCRDL